MPHSKITNGKTAQQRWRENNPQTWKLIKQKESKAYWEQLKQDPERLAEHNRKARERSKERTPLERKTEKLKYLYGLSLKEYQTLLTNQNHRCRICDKAVKLHVDHCHLTNKIRGLLCLECNTGLGKFKDTPELLFKAIEYLNGH